jgi:hypothetical protein
MLEFQTVVSRWSFVVSQRRSAATSGYPEENF